ncbi:MAG: hypothetical protein CFE21_04305 [Bacteroidetes bacterium B1(2017)]|nr:MAG: hypothetical protein CFE21_04305 [Bacteroidetes bacterium B1(2017)]
MKKQIFTLLLSLFIFKAFSQCTVSAGASPQFLCNGSSITLQATSGFSSYLWSTGASGSSITVSTPGTYTVKATSATNCIAYGSVEVRTYNRARFTLSGTMKCDTSIYTFYNQSNLALNQISKFK